ncbi:MAG: putative sugar nucleotidyl transferase [Bacteroidota bacterium]
MHYILFDEPILRDALKPLSLTRPIGDFRIGIQKISEKWIPYFGPSLGHLSEEYLAPKFAPSSVPSEPITYINAALLANEGLARAIRSLEEEAGLIQAGRLLAIKTSATLRYPLTAPLAKVVNYEGTSTFLAHITDLYRLNGQAIRADFEQLTKSRSSQEIRDTPSIVYNPEQVFLEEGVTMRACILNAENGPIYLGKNAKISEGAILIGPISIGEGAVVNPGAKLRGDTTIGPYCKVGGEISNSVLQAFSNKGHEGFIGNSLLGEWCNLGADTNSSNLKNNSKFSLSCSYF